MDERNLDFETLAAQAGLRMAVDGSTATSPAIVPSTTFTYESVDGVHEALVPGGQGYAYSRNSNPTVAALEKALAILEDAEAVVAFGSGMAAVHAALLGAGLEAGDRVVAATDLYGVTRGLLMQLANLGVETQYVDPDDVSEVESALRHGDARVLLFESISNPLLRVPDVRSLVDAAHRNRAVVVLDNTFATPYLFRPVQIGVDIVVHSATKYIAGHGDVTAGVVAASSSYADRIRQVRTATGGIISPFDAWLTLRGIRTLPLRVARQCQTALEIALWLDKQEWVERVYYPGLKSHPQHVIAHEQFVGNYGGMVAFDVRGDAQQTVRFIDALNLITAGTSLGDVESLVLYPPRSSHRTLTLEQQQEAGIGEGLVRLSVGLESPRDLINDLRGAAASVGFRQDAGMVV